MIEDLTRNSQRRLPREGRLLAINFGGIGDEILFLPTLDTIRNALPGWSITLMVEPRSASVAQVTDLIDEVIAFDIKKRPLFPGDLREVLSLIRSGGFDAVVSSGSSPLVSMLLFLSGVPVRVGYRTGALSTILLTDPAPLDREQYAGRMYHSLARQLVKSFGLPCQTATIPRATLNQGSLASMQDLLAGLGIGSAGESKSESKSKTSSGNSRIILFHPGTSRLAVEKGIIKTWPASSWVELAAMLESLARESGEKITIVLAGGPDDAEAIERITRESGDVSGSRSNHQIVSAYGGTKSLADLAALIHLSDLMVCVDSAPMHLAVALGKPLVALFGPTNPYLLLPDDPRFKFIWDNKNARRDMFDGLGVDIAPSTVLNTIKALLAQPALL
ncbi:MAG: glycosyltransferase family 9 protein [Candidatus Melainabacteria bacterium]|nr:glycosyltransferase family 9 protein [Candidatus Melainabacteria bacterium]